MKTKFTYGSAVFEFEGDVSEYKAWFFSITQLLESATVSTMRLDKLRVWEEEIFQEFASMKRGRPTFQNAFMKNLCAEKSNEKLGKKTRRGKKKKNPDTFHPATEKSNSVNVKPKEVVTTVKPKEVVTKTKNDKSERNERSTVPISSPKKTSPDRATVEADDLSTIFKQLSDALEKEEPSTTPYCVAHCLNCRNRDEAGIAGKCYSCRSKRN